MEKIIPQDIYSNTTFRDSVLVDTLNEIRKSTAEYTSQVQADLVGYHKFEYTMQDFKTDLNRTNTFSLRKKYTLNVPKQLIPTAKKDAYKKSDVFMKELSIKEISQIGKLFTYNFIVFIDGLTYTNIKIVMGEDMSRLIIYLNDDVITDGFDKEHFDELVGKNAPVTVFFIPNALYADYNTNKYVVKMHNHALDTARFTTYGENIDKSISYSAIASKDTGCSLLCNEVFLDSGVVQVCNGFEKYIKSSVLNLQVFTLNYFDTIIEIPVGGDYFELPIRQHVVPTTSFMAFYLEDGFLKFYHNLEVEYHYPNIYRVTGNDVPLRLHVFYYEPSDNIKFVNEMELYYRFFGKSVLRRWREGTIPPVIRDFKPKEFPVSIKHLLASEYSEDPLEYKIDRLNDFIDEESKNLSVYLMNMMKDRKKMKIYAKNVDFKSKLRHNVSEDIPTLDIPFKEPRYVFIFSKHFIHELQIRMFIDGLFYVCDHSYLDDKYYYFYIPTTMIKSNTIIEIEKHSNVSYTKDICFTDKNPIPIYFKENPCIASDTFFIDENGHYLEEEFFKFIITEDEREIEIDSNSNKLLGSNFKLKCTNPEYMNKKISFWAKRLSAIFEYKVNNEEDISKTLLIGTDISRHGGHFRIYRNGRMLPPDLYTLKFKKKATGYTVVNVKMQKKVGDVFHIEVNPNIYHTRYFNFTMPDTGELDFGGILNKPFNLKWFDVYLNGFRLTEDNFDILTPRYALIRNVKTTDNFLIMEKNWFNDVFKFRTYPNDQIPPIFDHNSCTDDELLDKIGDLREAVDKIKSQIKKDDTIENIITDFIEDLSDELVRLMPELVQHIMNINPFLNPDIQYETGVIPETIEKLIEERNNMISIFPDPVPYVTSPVLFNPDDDQLLDPDQIEIAQGVIMH